MDPRRERALVARSRLDASAFGELYDAHLPRIHAFILRRVGERRVAEDVASMTFERALAAIRDDTIGDESLGGWLHRAAARAVADHVGRSTPRGPARTAIGDASADRTLAAALGRDALRRALLALPEHHRRIIVLRFLDGLEPDELCAVLECSRTTLAVRLHRALAALRKAVARESIDAA
jgi:RNA polymerase sigma-70 factor (ECF subfamily)